jgi:protein-disulfide isomerase
MAEKTKSGGLLDRLVPILLLASIVMAFLVGILWQKVNSLEKGTLPTRALGEQAGDTVDNDVPPPDAGPEQGKLSEEQVANIAAVNSDDHIRGNPDAKVILIEYSDYECSFCAGFHETAKQVLDEYGDDVAWVYRHYPLDQIHSQARPAAIASECVAEAGGNDAFWKFTDAVFADQTSLDDLEALASTAGAGGSGFTSCLESEKYDERVSNDLTEGTNAGVRGTPGNFIVNQNGDAWFIPGAYPFEQIQPMIDEALRG